MNFTTTTNYENDELFQELLNENIVPGDENSRINDLLDESDWPLISFEIEKMNGLPPHKLDIKISLPIICLRNINPNEGLCNGTSLKILAISNRIIQAEITIGQFKGLKLYVKMHKIFKILWIIL
jgi:hypothetical protein